jgi:hypothetical protein
MRKRSTPLVTVLLLPVFFAINAFTVNSKNTVAAKGMASGIYFNYTAGANGASITYGAVTAPVQCVAVSAANKTATIYFFYKGATLGITVVDGNEAKGEIDSISDPFPVDAPDCSTVLPQFSYNSVTSGSILIK